MTPLRQRTRLLTPTAALSLAAVLTLAAPAHAQDKDRVRTIGTVATEDATVSGTLEVSASSATLVGSSTVTARDHTARIALSRGGSIAVCQTSRLRLTQGQAASPINAAPLLLALEKGSIEIEMAASYGDAILTPDLRIVPATPGPLDLRLRVTPSGDTCIENRALENRRTGQPSQTGQPSPISQPSQSSQQVPILDLTDAFSDQHYQLRPGQHVLFEHASLREVVDHETSSCGCPETPPDPTQNSIAAALLAPGTPTPAAPAPAASTPAAQQFPFPTAVSEGLAPAAPAPAEPAGQPHVQVATTLAFNPDEPSPIVQQTPSAPAPSTFPNPTPQPSAKPKPKGLFHSIGSFFRNLFSDNP